MKYLIVETHRTTEAVLFGGTLKHSTMKNMLGDSCKIVGAGICSFNWNPDEVEWDVYLLDGSTSLDIKKKDDDKFYIKFALND